MTRSRFARLASASLLGSASLVSLAGAAAAQTVVFSSAPAVPKGAIEPGREVSLAGGTVQVKLAGEAIASFVDSAQFATRADGGVDLRAGSVTIVARDSAVAVHLPDGVRGTVARGGTASFTAIRAATRGSIAAGTVSVTAAGVTRSFAAGQFWTAGGGRAPDRAIAGVVQAAPGTGPVMPLREGGIAAAAENGIPVGLGEALAGVGARGDIVAAARRIEAFDRNPSLGAFPSGDEALLVGFAAQANAALGAGGRPFNGAAADIIRTYFEHLAANNTGANFRTAYAQVLLNYLDLLRSGVLPSTFGGATQAQLNTYLAFIGRTDGFGSLSAANRQLLDAYLAFLQTGGQPNAFGTNVTNLTTAFLNFVRGGGSPTAFTQASASVVAQYLAIVNSGGLRTNLTTQNQALLQAYLTNNGVGFTQSYATSLAALVAFLNAGGLPSGYTVLPPATIRSYLETLETTGLFDGVLGAQAAFLRSYLSFLRGGGTADAFNALPINVARVNATALNTYVEYLLGGGLPSGYTTLTAAQIRAALDQLTATGQFNALLGQNAAFLSDYLGYLRTGADPDAFAGLPAVDVNAYASALTAFAAYLRAGNLPSGYTALNAQQVRNYLTALSASNRLSLLAGDAALLGDYLAFLRTGGAPDQFAGLPIVTYQGYAIALAAYFAYLNDGGLPTGYAALSQAQVRAFLDTLAANNQLALLGPNASFYRDYQSFLAGGGQPDAFAGLPIRTYQGFASALAAYLAYLQKGGLPSGYTPLTQAQVRQHLDALKATNQLTALLGTNAAFFDSYLAFVAGGGTADAFPGLPIVTYRGYADALGAYYTFLRGGGQPSAYTSLTQAQIRQYLDVLAGAGQLTRLLGDNGAFFTSYLAYLSGGGVPNSFPGLPSSTYGQYAAALTAYYTYLAGGGLPSGYTTVNQAQLRLYLDELKANNQLTALLGANAAFFEAYLTFVVGGGAADQFAGLPAVTYASYGSALSAFVTFLRGNGLPAGYAALSTAQLREYLEVLTANGQLARVGSAADQSLVRDYAAFLAGGGLPNAFPGLPAFVAYEAALRTYYAFLQGGGRPSGYTALTQAQIVDYIRLLDAAGLVASRLTAEEARFLRDYAAFVGAGNNADQFAGLPVNQPTTPVVTQGLANAPRGNGTVALAFAGKGLQPSSVTNGNVVLSGNAVSAFSGAGGATTQTAQTVEARTVDNTIALARLSNGTYNTTTTVTTNANEGMHLVWGTPATQVAASGSVAYGLVTSTAPTVDGGAVAPGTFAGNLAVDLATRRVGWNSVIGVGGTTYRFASTGGTAAPSVQATQLYSFSGASSTADNGLSGTAAGFLSGSGGAYAGFSYQASVPGGVGTVSGAAIFGSNQPTATLPAVTYVPGTGGNIVPMPSQPNYSYAGGFGNVARVRGYTETDVANAASQANGGAVNLSATVAADGGVTSFGGGQVGNNTRGTAAQADVSGDAAVLVGRWVGGSQTFLSSQRSYGANDSTHYVLLAPGNVTLPTSGTVQYTLIGATRPTMFRADVGPGVFDARLAITFAGQPRIGIEGSIFMPETQAGATRYSFATAGGIAAPSAAIVGASNLSFNAPLTGPGLACAANASCTIFFEGGFGGANTDRVGLSYATGSSGSNPVIYGAAAFARVGGGPVTTTVSNRNFVALAPLALNALNPTQGSYDVDGTGRVVGLTNFNGLYDRLGTAQIAESGQAAGGAIGWTRWSNGTLDITRNGPGSVTLSANQGYQILHGAPATAIPPSGTIAYTLAGGTAPTDHAGTRAPGTLVSGSAAIAFGAQSRVALDLVARLGGVDYNLFTTGKIAEIATSEVVLSSAGRFDTVIGPGGNVTGADCPATQCRPIWAGLLAGAGGAGLGVNYQVQNTATGARFGGIAAFERGAPVTGGAQTLSGQFTYAYAGSNLIDHGVTTTTYENNALKSYVSFLTGQARTAGVVQEGGRLAETIGWARWTGDSAGPLNNQGPNAGVHVVSGTPTAVATLPTSGTVQYALVGGTKPTLGNGAAAPGTITGNLSVQFGGIPRVGIDVTATVGEFGWRVQTPGGAANPATSTLTVGAQGAFSGTFTKQIGVTPTTSASCVTACSGTIGGQLFGAGASHASLHFNMLDSGPTGVAQASGIAIFTKP